MNYCGVALIFPLLAATLSAIKDGFLKSVKITLLWYTQSVSPCTLRKKQN